MTPLVSSNVVLASARTSWALTSPSSSVSADLFSVTPPPSSLHAVSPARPSTPTATPAARRCGRRMRSPFHIGGCAQARRQRACAGHDRLAPGRAGAVAPARWPRAARREQPLAADARAGARPAQAKTRVSSPLRKRWQRTPPVARPLAGYSLNGVTFTAPGSVPGSAVEDPETVTTTDSSGPDRPEPDDVFAGGQLDAGDAATGPPLRAAPRSAEVEQLGVGGDEAEVSSPVASSTAPTTSSSSLSAITSHSSLDRGPPG